MRNNALLNREIVQLHAEDAAFVAALRRRALDGPNYRLIDLYDLESRLQGHLDALALCGDAGAEAAEARLSPDPGFGEVFVACHVFLRNRDTRAVARLLELAETSTDLAGAVAAAASFGDPADAAEHVRDWIVDAGPTRAWIALEICGLRRVDPGQKLPQLMSYPDSRVVSRADALAAEIGRSDLLPLISRRVAGSGETGFWAAWAACLLGDRGAAPERLADALRPGLEPSLARTAAELVALAMPPDQARMLTRRLLETEGTRRWAVVALGSQGAAETLDWLVRQSDDPALARIAGASFALITGARLGPNNLELDVFPEPPEDPVVAADPQEEFIETNLYWPDRDRVSAWLDAHRGRFRPDTRHLLGQPAWSYSDPQDQPAKYQLEFRALAIEIALRRPAVALPNWRAPVQLSGGSFTRSW